MRLQSIRNLINFLHPKKSKMINQHDFLNNSLEHASCLFDSITWTFDCMVPQRSIINHHILSKLLTSVYLFSSFDLFLHPADRALVGH